MIFSIEFLNMAERSFESERWRSQPNGNGSRVRGRFQHGGTLSEINVTPFVDVLLVLLINLHADGACDGVRHRCGCACREDDQSHYKWICRSSPSPKIPKCISARSRSTLTRSLQPCRKRYGKSQTVYVRADKRVPWEIVAQVLAELGAAKIGVSAVTRPEDINPEATLMPYADAFDQREPLGKPFLGSLALHGGVAALLVAGNSHRQSHAGDMG